MLFTITRLWTVLILLFGFLIQFAFLVQAERLFEEELFPIYESVKPNVNFWEKIFSVYGKSEGVIHDNSNMAVIYEIVELSPQTNRQQRRKNRKLIKNVKNKYKTILKKLSENPEPDSEEEKRILELFGERATCETFKVAYNNVRFQRGQKDSFRKGLIRSGAFSEQMKNIFKAHGLPEDLAYLPFVESSFNYKAFSKYGAAGIWQFTYHTGKRFMRIDYVVDERWDPITSTHAAAKLLKHNHKMLGNWALALTAYNHGAASMRRAVREKEDYETIFNEYDGKLFGFASRNFYSEFLAAKNLAKNYKTNFGDLTLDQPFIPIKVETPGFVPVREISNFFNVSLATIKKLNPGLRRSVFREQKYIPKGYELKLPALQNIIESISKIPADILRNRQKRSRLYRVKKGDTAGRVARKHGVSLSDLIAVNRLGSRATLYVGNYLRIPSKINSKKALYQKPAPSAKKRSVFAMKDSTPKNRSKIQGSNRDFRQINLEIPQEKLVVINTFQKEETQYGVIKVLEGETLGHYADWLDTPTQNLRILNNIPFGKSIRLSKKVILPFGQIDKTAFEERRYEFHEKMIEDFLDAFTIKGTKEYRIRKGENIWRLCKTEFSLPIWLVKKFNSAIDFNDIKTNQVLLIPLLEKTDGA
ncbi:transglycosylase SLT domain-containing protein [bacterium]|nr:transglycosylase SLT domain-containing protein [bacterium]